MKKAMLKILVGVFAVNIFSMSVSIEASWLSKTWKKIERSVEKTSKEIDNEKQAEMRDLPKSTDAEYEKLRKPPYINGFGKPLSNSEFTVAGVPMGAHVNDIIKSLGKPTSENIKYYHWYRGQLPTYHLEYGGISFDTQYMYWYRDATEAEHISKITIRNRDGATARGISVGDTLKQVYNTYGRPTFITKKNEWFYGITYPDSYHGIWFVNDGYRVTKIKLGEASFEYGRSRDTF